MSKATQSHALRAPFIPIAPEFTTLDGAQFRAATALEFCHQLREASHNPGRSFAHYLAATARAATLYNGAHHRGDTAENLTADLITSGLVVVTEAVDPNFPRLA
jgi:hypothetical protein